MNRNEFFTVVSQGMQDSDDLHFLQIAYWFAKDQHNDQQRDDGVRYFEHCREVALILMREHGIYAVKTLALGLLHDVIEDTFAPPVALLKLFGTELYSWVVLLSESYPVHHAVTGKLLVRAKRDKEEYFRGILEAPLPVRQVKCADRMHNLRTCGPWSPERKRRKAEETRKFVLPIAEATNPAFAEELQRLTDAILNEQPSV